MGRTFSKRLGMLVMVAMLCMTGLSMSCEAQAQRCVDNGDGTVTDNGTGLMWQKATAGPMDWVQAMRYASSLSLGGHSDWWLPSKEELWGMCSLPCRSLMDVSPGRYWSSTTYTNYTNYAWGADFEYICSAGSNLKSVSHYVRAVRSGQ